MNETCETCLYSRDDTIGKIYCHRHAPGAITQTGVSLWVWPEVPANGWCGEGAAATTGTPFSSALK
jgi:hypothetical protein